jgi:HlyD family secretion protein
VSAAQIDFANARRTYERLKKSAGAGATSQQDMDTAEAAFDVAEAKLRVNQKALELAVKGPRKEDIAEARATLRALEADLAAAKQNLAYGTLASPANGVVQSRILEPGEMASPQRPVLTIAITDPKWVRVYASEPDLGKIRPGMAAAVTTDSFPGKIYEGWVGFISPVASFTPKTVETTDLRTSLVYEVRVFVTDPSDEMRLGMPATVRVTLPRGEGAGIGIGSVAGNKGA